MEDLGDLSIVELLVVPQYDNCPLAYGEDFQGLMNRGTFHDGSACV